MTASQTPKFLLLPLDKQLHRMPSTAALFAFLLKGSEDYPRLSRSVRPPPKLPKSSCLTLELSTFGEVGTRYRYRYQQIQYIFPIDVLSISTIF
eukprot:SAG22_NODE_629_length_8389_cov_6.069723_4_plen_94_part_00